MIINDVQWDPDVPVLRPAQVHIPLSIKMGPYLHRLNLRGEKTGRQRCRRWRIQCLVAMDLESLPRDELLPYRIRRCGVQDTCHLS